MTDTIAQRFAMRGMHVVVGVLVAATPWAVSCSAQAPLPPDPPSVNPGRSTRRRLGVDRSKGRDRGQRRLRRWSMPRVRRHN